MENYELSSESLKQIGRVTAELKELKSELENNGGAFKEQSDSSSSTSTEKSSDSSSTSTEQSSDSSSTSTEKSSDSSSTSTEQSSDSSSTSTEQSSDSSSTSTEQSSDGSSTSTEQSSDSSSTSTEQSSDSSSTSTEQSSDSSSTSTEQSSDSSSTSTEQSSDSSSTSTEQKESSTNADELFYEINDNKVVLKMDVVKSYLENIKDKEWSDLKSGNKGAWIMAVQIALRSPQIGGENKDKYGDIVIDGVLGPNTKESVKKFQEDNGCKVDGLPGKETMNKIYDILTGKVQAGTGEKNESEGDDSNTNSGSEASGSDSNEEVNKETGDNSDIKESSEKEPKDTEIVPLKNYMSDIKYDLKYATIDNSFGVKMYPDGEENLKLQYQAIKKLKKAQEFLKGQGYQLKIWDAYRPKDAQQKLWDNYKGPSKTKRSNVAVPGTSYHGSGKAVDLTLLDSNGNEVKMPTGFDDFSGNARWDNIDKLGTSSEEKKNAYVLKKAMEDAGFSTIKSEWWHYQI